MGIIRLLEWALLERLFQSGFYPLKSAGKSQVYRIFSILIDCIYQTSHIFRRDQIVNTMICRNYISSISSSLPDTFQNFFTNIIRIGRCHRYFVIDITYRRQPSFVSLFHFFQIHPGSSFHRMKSIDTAIYQIVKDIPDSPVVVHNNRHSQFLDTGNQTFEIRDEESTEVIRRNQQSIRTTPVIRYLYTIDSPILYSQAG